MTYADFRVEMELYLAYVNERALKEKYSEIAGEEMLKLFRRFDSVERKMADQVVIEWVTSEDPHQSFMAIFLINELKIVDANPALLKLIDLLRESTAVGAPARLKMIENIQRNLK